jgi:DNA polymerase elongation subunit (family B)
MATPLKILVFDIETAPTRAFVWRFWQENVSVDQVIANSYMLTWAAKWYGQDKILSDSLRISEVADEDDERIVESIAALIREADVLIAHNLDKFDWPVINTRVAKHQLENLGVPTMIDTLKLARKNFKFPHNSLDGIASYFGLPRKLKTEFKLWADVVEGDEMALKRMLKYNKQDVKVLEAVFNKMKPYVKRLPRLFDPTIRDDMACARCGTLDNFQRRGYYRTQLTNFVKLRCNVCGHYTRRRATDVRFGTYPL